MNPIDGAPNMSRLTSLVLLASLAAGAAADDRRLAVRLGHGPEARLLILHGDDLGMCQSSTAAAREAFVRGVMNSGSAMAPCPWFGAMATWAAEQEEKPDLGLHLTLTSEWRHYRWRPLVPGPVVPGLVDRDGFLHREVADVRRRATAAEVEVEIRAQIARARHFGLEPTHLDSHMGTLFTRLDFFQVYVDVGREEGIVPMVPKLDDGLRDELREAGILPLIEVYFEGLEARGFPLLDRLVTETGGRDYEERKAWLLAFLADLEPGVTQLILHPAVEGPELAAITGTHRRRDEEYRLLIDPDVRAAIADEGIVLVSWREINALWNRAR